MYIKKEMPIQIEEIWDFFLYFFQIFESRTSVVTFGSWQTNCLANKYCQSSVDEWKMVYWFWCKESRKILNVWKTVIIQYLFLNATIYIKIWKCKVNIFFYRGRWTLLLDFTLQMVFNGICIPFLWMLANM